MAAKVTVSAVSGDNEFYRRRFVQTTIRTQVKNGWGVSFIDGASRSELAGALAGDVFLDVADEATLHIVENPEKADLVLLEDHAQSGDPHKVLLLHCEGTPKKNTKFAKFLDTLGKQHKVFAAPPEWQAAELAAEFCLAEARTYGAKLEERNAQQIVILAGTDFGVLSFEIQKMALLALADEANAADEKDGLRRIRSKHIRGGLAALAQAQMQPLLDALMRRNPAEVARALGRIRKSERDSTMRLCRWLGKVVTRWVTLADLHSRGMSPEDIVARLQLGGSNPVWFVKEKLLPQVRLWTVKDLLKLLQALAQAERAVLNGHVHPEVEFVSSVLLAL
jgi:DNA polymerase III delta subunit